MTIKDNLLDIDTPRVMFASPVNCSAISSILLGIVSAISNMGVSIAISNISPSLVQSTHLRRISGRFAYTSDLWSLTEGQLMASFVRIISGADLALFVGNRGIYDSCFDGSWASSESCIASVLKIPIILIIDASGYYESISAVIKGIANYRNDINVAGVIAYKIQNLHHSNIIKISIQSLGSPVYIGGLPSLDRVTDKGIAGANSSPSLLQHSLISYYSDVVTKCLDLDRLMEISKLNGSIKVPQALLHREERNPVSLRIAVADDVAFHLTIQDNLDMLQRTGAKLVFFSPIADSKLPSAIHALYLPSGYIQLYADDLQQNTSMLESIADFARKGGVVLAEGSSTAFLTDKVVLSNGEMYQMIGLIDGIATAIKRDSELDYATCCELICTKDSPIATEGQAARGYMDSRWLIRPTHRIPTAFKVNEVDLSITFSQIENIYEDDGLMPLPNVICVLSQIHWASNPVIAERFLSFIAHATRG